MKFSIYIFLILLITSCGQPQARKPVIQKTSTFLKESIERNKVINQSEESMFKDLIASDSVNSYLTSPNGFWYYYTKRDSISSTYPVRGDEVVYEYEITDVNGDLLYSREELGVRNYLVDKEELISGLQAGLKLMKEGEEVTFLFPSHKAYGYSGYKKIGSNQPLIYKVELKQIKSTN